MSWLGKFLLVAPGSSVPTPDGAGRIELHSKKAKMLGRVELRDDPEGAVTLQRAFTVTASWLGVRDDFRNWLIRAA
jgi:hypothetical protein